MKKYNLKAYLIPLSAALCISLASCKDDDKGGVDFVEQSAELGENIDIQAEVTVKAWDKRTSDFANIMVDWSEKNELAIFSQSSKNSMYRLTTEDTTPSREVTTFLGKVNIAEGDMLYALYPAPTKSVNAKGIYVDVSDQSLVEQRYAGAGNHVFSKDYISEFSLYSQLAKARVSFLVSEKLDIMSDLDYVQLTSTSFYTARYLDVATLSDSNTLGWSGGVKSSKGLIIDPEEVTKSESTTEIDGENYYTYSFDLYLFPFEIKKISFTFYDKSVVKIYTGDYTIYSSTDAEYVAGTIASEDFLVPDETLAFTVPFTPSGVQNEDNTIGGTENGGSIFDPEYKEPDQEGAEGGNIDNVGDQTFN